MKSFTALSLGCLWFVVSASAATMVDEFGQGIWWTGAPLLYSIGANPNSGLGSTSVLTYFLPEDVYGGDLRIRNAQGDVSGIIRFAGNNQMIFLSDGASGLMSPADVPHLPTVGGYGYVDDVSEQVTGNDTFAVWTGTFLQPGYDPQTVGYVDYKFVTSVPEPSCAVLALVAAGGAFFLRHFRKVTRISNSS